MYIHNGMTDKLTLQRDPKIREELKRDLLMIVRYHYRTVITPENIVEEIISGLEQKGWHGVRDKDLNKGE